MAFPNYLSATEQNIIGAIVTKALAKDYLVSVYDGEEWALVASTDYEAITAEVAATDITHLKFRDAAKQPLGSIIFVHGNDEDVVHDHSDNDKVADLLK